MKRVSGIDRRSFIKQVAAGAATAGLAVLTPRLVGTAAAAQRDHILIGQPSPLTGPLAPFGEPTMWLTQRVVEEINRDGGIFIKAAGKKLPVKVKVVDTQSDPNTSAEMASKLILGEKIDLMVVLHTPNTVDPVTSICERYQMPCIALDSPLDSFIENAPHKWAFLGFWNVVEDIFPVYTGMWEQVATNKRVGLFFASDPGGIPWYNTFKGMLPPKGYTVVDQDMFQPGVKDFSAYIDKWRKENVEIIVGNTSPPDWIACWRQCHQMGYKPKVATIGRACLFPSAMVAMGGGLPEGISTEVWWSPYHPYSSSLAGYNSKELCDAYEKGAGKSWTQPLGYEYAAYEIAADVLKRSGSLDKEALRQSIAATNLNTMVGHIQFNKENYCRTPVVGGQWRKGQKWPWEVSIVYNREHPEIPAAGSLVVIS